MNTLSEVEFLAWAKAQGIVLDPSYPKAVILSFQSSSDASRFWEVPQEPERRPFFLSNVVGLMGEWARCYVWRHSGSWPDAKAIHPRRVNDAVEYQILLGLGLPMGTASVLTFSSEETASLLTLLFSTTVFGWSVGEDLYVIPDNGRVIVQTDHHGVVHVGFREPGDIEVAIERMKAASFPLPSELPDGTFKEQGWIVRDEP